MHSAFAELPFEDLADKGYLLVRGFITPAELALLQDDWRETARAMPGGANTNYPIYDVRQPVAWRFHKKISGVCQLVAAETGIEADVDAGGSAYFAIEKGIDFCWHQDHESYFVYQQHINYLNFYIPIIKPDPSRTNLSLVPMDELARRIPQKIGEIINSGAKRYYPQDGETLVFDDDTGAEFWLPFNLDDLAVTPNLNPGDLLLLRGDIIHRTQDTATDRVAVSFRRTKSSAPIRRSRLWSGCDRKRQMIEKNLEFYERVGACLASFEKDEISAAQFQDWVLKRSAETAL